VFSPGGRLFPKLRPRPAPRAGAGRASPLGARRPSAAALFERSRAGHGSGHPAPDGSSKPDGGTASIVRKVIFRRPGRRQAPAPNPHPFLSSSFFFRFFRRRADFSVCRFSIASAAFPASAQESFTILLSLFCSILCSLLSTLVTPRWSLSSGEQKLDSQGRRRQVTPEAKPRLLKCPGTDVRIGRQDCS
jgi:hypothetical protein